MKITGPETHGENCREQPYDPAGVRCHSHRYVATCDTVVILMHRSHLRNMGISCRLVFLEGDTGARNTNGFVQQFCDCGRQNVKSVILMSRGLFLLLHFAFHFSSYSLFMF